MHTWSSVAPKISRKPGERYNFIYLKNTSTSGAFVITFRCHVFVTNHLVGLLKTKLNNFAVESSVYSTMLNMNALTWTQLYSILSFRTCAHLNQTLLNVKNISGEHYPSGLNVKQSFSLPVGV